MDSTMIKKHHFEEAKRRIGEYSKNLPQDQPLTLVREDEGLFGLFDHKVTGKELNALVKVVQNDQRAVNSVLIQIIHGFKEIYNTFDYLDSEYVNGIIETIKDLEKVSKQVKIQQEETGTHVEALDMTVGRLLALEEIVKEVEKKVKEEFDADQLQKCETKIKIAYFIGGCSVVLSLTSLILQLLGVL